LLARARTLRHPLNITFETPLLVPSFSSKGFGLSRQGNSAIGEAWNLAKEYLTDSVLLSAYDLAHAHMPPIEGAPTDIVIVDSGGYEISPLHDFSTIYLPTPDDVTWSVQDVAAVYDAWPAEVPAIFVNYDHHQIRKPLHAQIDDAREFLGRYPRQMHCLLLKPETADQSYVQLADLKARIHLVADFHVLGLTEKELGNSVLGRMMSIAELRLAMDDAGVTIPLHIFGSLDPIGSVLYFLSGAEIFDGLTWLRYGYHKGMAIYSHNFGAMKVGVHRKDDFVKAAMLRDNLSALLHLRNAMLKYIRDGSVAHFGEVHDVINEAFTLLKSKNQRIK
jgi:hypothetical protein